MAESPLFFLTTPIYYVSAAPHLGHSYTTIVGDALCRYQRLRRGDASVFYLTGTDEHGDKLERRARDEGQSPQAFVDQVAAAYRDAWQALEIRYDDFIRTTEPRHEEVVTALWRRLEAQGDIYKARYEGLYCVACESFYLEKDLLEGQLCPDHKRKVELVSEEGYFFRLSKYEGQLLDHYAAHPDFVEPAMRLNEVRAFVERGLRDLSVSRSSFRWGIPVPGDPEHVIYVWIDALTNYWSAMQEPASRRAFWGTKEEPLAVHLIGKEISRFHAVYWPAMLLSAGLPLPRKIVAHGWWTVDGEKMSNTLRNVVNPLTLTADIGVGALRYFLLREVPLGQDGDFSYDALIQRYNSELANDLGNLLNRAVSMTGRYCAGVAPRWTDAEADTVGGDVLREAALRVRGQVEAEMEAMQPGRAIEALFSLVREGNSYLEKWQPWKRVLTDPRGTGHVLYNALELLRWIGLMLEPFMPERAIELRRQIGVSDPARGEWPRSFGELPDGAAVQKGDTLFPRIDKDREAALLTKWRAERRAVGDAAQTEAAVGAAPAVTAAPAAVGGQATDAPQATPPALATELVSIDDFKRLDLRAALVLSAERIPKKDRLLKVTLDLGVAQRTVVAGIAETIAPEALVGRTVLYLANLKPAKIGGVLSEGMILALGGERVLGLTAADRAVPPGTPVR